MLRRHRHRYSPTGSLLNLVTIQLYAQIRGDVLHDQNLGYALAFGMIVITGISNGAYIGLRGRSDRGCDEALEADPLDRCHHRHALFHRAADRDIRIFAAPAPRGVQLRGYEIALADENFRTSFFDSTVLSLLTIVVGVLLVVPTADWIQLWLQRPRGIVEFITLLPLAIPAICLVFGYLRLYNTSFWRPLTGNDLGTWTFSFFSYTACFCPHVPRGGCGHAGDRLRTLTEAAEILGAKWPTILFRAIFSMSASPS